MHIKVINPNTTWAMTRDIEQAARRAAAPGTRITAASPDHGPASLECCYDEVYGAVGVLEEVRKGIAEGMDGAVIACFGDPGLLAARELAACPVVGIAEAAMRTATHIATGFSILAMLPRARTMFRHMVRSYGMEPWCLGIHTVDLPVLSLEADPAPVQERLILAAQKAVREDGAEAILLGCAGMSSLCDALRAAISVPVIDGVTAAVKTVEMLVSLELRQGKNGDFAPPPPKNHA